MKKQNLILIPLCIGFVLMAVSWYLSYPLTISSPLDFIFNHVSPLYWVSLFLIFASLFLAAVFVKSNVVRLAVCVCIVLSMFSIRYFFYMLPSSDAHTVRGLTEYFIETGNLDPSKPSHAYYQWPFFFILGKIATSVSGLTLMSFEFLLFTVLGVVYVMALYAYAHRFSKEGSYIAVIAYFLIIYWFFNYQFAPFSLAMGLLFILFMLESQIQKARSLKLTIASMILFAGIAFTHPFAGVLFIGYLLILYIINRERANLQLFAYSLVVYLLVSMFYAGSFFVEAVRQLATEYSGQYQTILERTFASRIAPSPIIDSVAQTFSRTVVIASAAITGLGLLVLLTRRSLRRVDLAILVSSSAYAIAGILLPLLGNRAWFAIVIPISLGAIFVLEGRFRKYAKVAFLVLLTLFAFIPLTESFSDTQIFFQTKNEYKCANFAVTYCNWSSSTNILSHFRLMEYLRTRTASSASFAHDLSTTFLEDVTDYNYIIYTVGLGKNLLLNNYSMAELQDQIEYNRVFDSFDSFMITKP